MNPVLKVTQASLSYASVNVVREVSFSLNKGQIGCLLGPSGCGKTTLLKAIAGFEPLRAGEIAINQRIVSQPGQQLSPYKRNVGMVFQDFALFPHLTVAENIAFGIRRLPAAQQRQRVQELLALIELPDMEQRPIHALSGGQQQRVALARALATSPDILLLDEPFSSLDAELRASLALQLAQIIRKTGISALLVTHDKSEAFAMADVMGVMHSGKLMQWDRPQMVYQHPASVFVAEFMGLCGWLEGSINQANEFVCALGAIALNVPTALVPQTQVRVLFRPQDIALTPQQGKLLEVIEVQYRGQDYLYRVRTETGEQLYCAVPLAQHKDGITAVNVAVVNSPETVFAV